MPQPPIKLYRFKRSEPRLNFGDDMSPALLEFATGRKVELVPAHLADVIGLGSILHRVCRIKGFLKTKGANAIGLRKGRPIVWGSGFAGEQKTVFTSHLDIRLVRGAKTQAVLGAADVAFGDPGLVVKDVFPAAKSKKFRLGIVPHYVDKDSPLVKEISENTRNSRVIPVEQNPSDVLRQITECELILSSSLHGLISADSYGIPNARLQLSDKIKGGDFKFLDYATSLDRPDISPIRVSEIELFCQHAAGDWDYQKGVEGLCHGIIKTVSDI